VLSWSALSPPNMNSALSCAAALAARAALEPLSSSWGKAAVRSFLFRRSSFSNFFASFRNFSFLFSFSLL
jgi:hypothetical protein